MNTRPDKLIRLFVQEEFGSREYVIPEWHPLYWHLFDMAELAENLQNGNAVTQ